MRTVRRRLHRSLRTRCRSLRSGRSPQALHRQRQWRRRRLSPSRLRRHSPTWRRRLSPSRLARRSPRGHLRTSGRAASQRASHFGRSRWTRRPHVSRRAASAPTPTGAAWPGRHSLISRGPSWLRPTAERPAARTGRPRSGRPSPSSDLGPARVPSPPRCPASVTRSASSRERAPPARRQSLSATRRRRPRRRRSLPSSPSPLPSGRRSRA
mmetsp:Transcript_4247/g.13383  ORF Transcript_4247/g.13383 Transcript_4247/m.13383 type:complete len:211 (+) Transcript_4247:264-896(+)